MSDCPYCNLAVKKGELFCSRHGADMEQLDSGVFFIHSSRLEECDWHITRLSLNFNLDGRQVYTVANRAHVIDQGKYLLINEGNSFKTSLDSEANNRMVTVAFRVGMAAQIAHTLTCSEHRLLDTFANSPITFPEKTYSIDRKIQSMVFDLVDPTHDGIQIQEKIEALLVYLLKLQLKVREEILSISKVKVSTREEIYKRLHWALEYLHDNFHEDISVEQLAEQSCLSTFHFKRLFHEIFGMPPYQYLKKLRLEKACELLGSDLSVQEVCRSVGWKDPSSFTRLFKSAYHITPYQFRISQTKN